MALSILLASCSSNTKAFEPETPELENDEPWDFENLDREELDTIRQTIATDYYSSYGWFPSTYNIRNYNGITYTGHNNFDWGRGISPIGGSDIGKQYSATPPLPDPERRQLYRPLSEGAAVTSGEDFGPNSEGMNIGIVSSFTTGLPLILDFTAEYFLATNLAYTQVRDVPYRNHRGTLSSYDEGNYIVLCNQGVSLGVDALIPLYGSFIYANGVNIFNTYAFSVGYRREFALDRQFYQYSKIETGADRIRYRNGLDTVRLAPEATNLYQPEEMNLLPIGLHWRTGGGPVSLGFSMRYAIGLTSLLDQQNWRGDKLGFEVQLSFNFW